MASFALGEKAMEAAHKSDLSASVLKVMDSANKYAEGRGVRLEARSAEDVRNVEKLVVIKMANYFSFQHTTGIWSTMCLKQDVIRFTGIFS